MSVANGESKRTADCHMIFNKDFKKNIQSLILVRVGSGTLFVNVNVNVKTLCECEKYLRLG